MNRELLQQALNALRISAPLGHAMEDYEYRHKVIKDIEAALAEPEQDTYCKYCNGIGCVACDARCLPEQEPQMIQIKDGQLSYIKKPWVGLTNEELVEIRELHQAHIFNLMFAVEAKIREKNDAV